LSPRTLERKYDLTAVADLELPDFVSELRGIFQLNRFVSELRGIFQLNRFVIALRNSELAVRPV
jgi:hypothetical protein